MRSRRSGLADAVPAGVACALLVAVGSVVLGRTGRLADVERHREAYDRLVVLAREADRADSSLGGFTVGQRGLSDEAARLMTGLNVAGVNTYREWAWVRGRAGLLTETSRVTLVPDGDAEGHAVLAPSRLGGRWVQGHLYRWDDEWDAEWTGPAAPPAPRPPAGAPGPAW